MSKWDGSKPSYTSCIMIATHDSVSARRPSSQVTAATLMASNYPFPALCEPVTHPIHLGSKYVLSLHPATWGSKLPRLVEGTMKPGKTEPHFTSSN